MNEDEFTDALLVRIAGSLSPHKVARKRALLYDLSFDHRGQINLGVDPDSGEPIRGKGRGFEQDILVFDELYEGHTSVIPRIVIEVKYNHVTTHDVIVYSEKADRIRRVYPYVRYGMLLGGFSHIPGRVLRLGQRFDFVTSISDTPSGEEVAALVSLLHLEASTSVTLTDYLFNGVKIKSLHKSVIVTK